MESNKVTKSHYIGWVLTILLSVAGAWGAINARVYEIEKQVEMMRLEVNATKLSQAQQASDYKEILKMFNRIDKNITEINGKLELKADKKFIQ